MSEARTAVYFSGRSIYFSGLVLLFASACGLGMDSQARLERGEEAFAEGEYRAAIIDAKNVLSDEPDNTAARLLLARASVAVGDAAAAEKELRKAIEHGIEPAAVLTELGQALLMQRKFDEVISDIAADAATSDALRLAVLRMRGEAFLELGQPATARELYGEALSLDSGDVESQLGIVKTYAAEGNFLQARETLNTILDLDDRNVASWLTSGSLAMRMRDSNRAISDFRKAARLAQAGDDSSAEMHALAGLSDALLGRTEHDEARDVHTRMLEIAPDDLRTRLLSARLASIDADWGSASDQLQGILRDAPRYRPAQMLLGYVHKESGNLGQAELYLAAVVADAPGDANARRLLAETRLALDRADEAREALDPLLTGQDSDVGSLSLAAVASLDLGEFDVATELLQRGIAADPRNIDLRIQLALAYFQMQKPDKVRETLASLPERIDGSNDFRRDSLLVMTQMAEGEEALARESAKALVGRWPDRAEAYSLLGAVEMSMGEAGAARQSFQAASRLAPDDIQVIRYLARLDEQEGDVESAVGRYELILELAPTHSETMSALARQYAQAGDYGKAREWLEKSVDSDPEGVAAREALASLLLALRDHVEAARVASAGLEHDPDNERLLSTLGRAQLGQGNSRGAEITFRKLVSVAPDESEHRVNLARAQAINGKTGPALETLADDATPPLNDLRSAVMYATLKARGGEPSEAEAIARRLQQAHPDRAVPFALEAELRAKAGDLAAASAAYDEALSRENIPQLALRAFRIRDRAGIADPRRPLIDYLAERPFDSVIRVYLAQAYQNSGDIAGANAEYERVLSDEPGNFVVANNLAWNYFQTGDPRAEQTARLAHRIQPQNGSVNDTLGWILVNKSNYDEGIPILRRAVELDEGRPEIRYHLAAGLAASGETSEAEKILRDILSTDVAFSSRQQAQELLSRL